MENLIEWKMYSFVNNAEIILLNSNLGCITPTDDSKYTSEKFSELERYDTVTN